MAKGFSASKIIIYFIVSLFALVCLLPFWLVAAGSITLESVLVSDGYKLIPRAISFQAYKMMFTRHETILNAYKVTVITTLAGTAASVFISAMMAYGMSRPGVKYRWFISGYAIITMLFSGGIVPWYIICVNFLKLKDNYAALIVPQLMSAWNVFLIRNYFQSIPGEMHESAKIDGAGSFYIFMRIIMPLSLPVLATVSLFVALGYWNGWWLGLMLIDRDELKPLQIMLRSIITRMEYLKQLMSDPKTILPAESTKMATCIITIGPIIFLYPFIQRYFVKGIMVGAIKG